MCNNNPVPISVMNEYVCRSQLWSKTTFDLEMNNSWVHLRCHFLCVETLPLVLPLWSFWSKDCYAFVRLCTTVHALVVEESFANNLYMCCLDHVATMRNFQDCCYEYKKATKATTTPSKTSSCAMSCNGGEWKWWKIKNRKQLKCFCLKIIWKIHIQI